MSVCNGARDFPVDGEINNFAVWEKSLRKLNGPLRDCKQLPVLQLSHHQQLQSSRSEVEKNSSYLKQVVIPLSKRGVLTCCVESSSSLQFLLLLLGFQYHPFRWWNRKPTVVPSRRILYQYLRKMLLPSKILTQLLLVQLARGCPARAALLSSSLCVSLNSR